MAAYLDITEFPRAAIAGVQHQFRVTARLASGAVDAAYVGTVAFTSTDPAASLPANYTFVGADAGTKLFRVRMRTTGTRTVTANDGAATKATARTQVIVRPLGWGFDDVGLIPYGDAAAGIGVYIRSARAISTKEVEVEVSNLVQDNSPFLTGDALNPATWALQRLDTAEFLNVVAVRQTGTYSYVLLCLEEFGSVTVLHRASSSTLLDATGQPLVSPRQADFYGLLDEDKQSTAARLATRKVSVRDVANPQFAADAYAAGALQITASGDYRLEEGASLVRKLLLRRCMSSPGDFFHLPTYGLGVRVKEPLPSADLGRLKAALEKAALEEPEVENASASLLLKAEGVLEVRIKARLRHSGESVEVGFTSSPQGVP